MATTGLKLQKSDLRILGVRSLKSKESDTHQLRDIEVYCNGCDDDLSHFRTDSQPRKFTTHYEKRDDGHKCIDSRNEIQFMPPDSTEKDDNPPIYPRPLR